MNATSTTTPLLHYMLFKNPMWIETSLLSSSSSRYSSSSWWTHSSLQNQYEIKISIFVFHHHHNYFLIPKQQQTIVYPSGSMLEMSNGYPHSHSPLVGSPSPGPSPGIGGRLI